MAKWVLPEGRFPLEDDWFKTKSLDFDSVTRVEVIDKDGRSYSNWAVNNLQLQLQDEGRTLKIFITEQDSSNND